MSWSGKTDVNEDTLYFRNKETLKEVEVQEVHYEEKENGRVFFTEVTYTCPELELEWTSEYRMNEWFQENGYESDY